jgi:hypothetical protein
MTQDEIIEMAREAGINYRELSDEFATGNGDGVEIEQMEAFAKLVAAKAIEQRTWVGLTDDEISELSKGHIVRSTYAKAIEAKLKERNT